MKRPRSGPRPPRWIPFALIALVLALIVGGHLAAESSLRQQALARERQHVQHALESLRVRIERVVYQDLYAVQALATYIGIYPDLDQAAFERFARSLLGDTMTLRNLAAAPDMVVRFVYPRIGNEAALGLDYRAAREQSAAALRALDERTLVIAGPVALVQGGHGFIARAPVIVHAGDARQPWGLVSAVMDRDTFFSAIGLHETSRQFDVALRGRDSLGEGGAVFFGPATLFVGDAVKTTVNLPGGSWVVAAAPRGGWLARTPPLIPLLRITTLLVLAMFVALMAARLAHARDARRNEQALRESEADFRSLFESANDGIVISDARTLAILNVNEQAARSLGYSREQLLRMHVGDLYADADRPRQQVAYRQMLEAGAIIFEAQHQRADGTLLPVEISTRLISRERGDILISLVRDISERKQIQEALRRSQQDVINAIEAMNEGFVLWDDNDRIKLFNARFTELYTGARREVFVGQSFENLLRASAREEIDLAADAGQAWIDQRLLQHRSGASSLELRTRAGRYLRVSERRTPDGYTVGIYTDVTEIKNAEEAIRYRAYYDALTELPNREVFMQQLVTAVGLAQRHEASSAVMFIDLDRFKNVNDTMGHEIGDELLKEAARRISGCVRRTDMVSRFGGDEFTVILRDLRDSTNAARIAETIIGRLVEPFPIGNQTLYCGASIGITLCPDDGTDSQVLLRNADMAMYQAKAQGGNAYRFFTVAMTARAEQFVTMEKDLRKSIGSDEFSLAYQPIVRLSDGTTLGVEALLRWTHPRRGAVPPSEFIPVAEETRTITELGAWVLREACTQAAPWCRGSSPLLERLSVNVSVRQLWAGFDAAFVRGVLDETGFPPECLLFEMTESLLIEEDERIEGILRGFRELGIGLAVDDFGTGYSALGYLRRLPVTVVKVDRSFVSDIETNPSDAHLVEAIIAMAGALGITVVAEGVESAGQARILRELGCAYAQGHYYGRPRPAADIAAAIARA